MFVQRRNGVVVGVFANRQEGYAEEELPETHPDIQNYRNAASARATLKRSQIMRQLYAEGKLDAARSAVASADALTQELWTNDDWRLATIQQAPFSSMISALSIDVPTFWAAAARQPT